MILVQAGWVGGGSVACHGISHHSLGGGPLPLLHCLHTIVQISMLLGLLVSIRAGSSQARVGMECPERVARRSIALETPIHGPVWGHTGQLVTLASLSASCPRPCCRALCHCHHVSPPIFPLSSFVSSCHMHGSLSFLCFSLSDIHALPAASTALCTPLLANQQWNQPTDIRGLGRLLSLPAPGCAQHKCRAWGRAACAQVPSLPCSSISGAHSRNASPWSKEESKMGEGSEIKLNSAPVLRKKSGEGLR